MEVERPTNKRASTHTERGWRGIFSFLWFFLLRNPSSFSSSEPFVRGERRRKKVAEYGGGIRASEKENKNPLPSPPFFCASAFAIFGRREGGWSSLLPFLPPFSRPSSPSSSSPSFFFHFPPPVSAISEMTVPLSTPPLFLQLPFSLPLSLPCVCVYTTPSLPLSSFPLRLLFPSPRQ